MSTHLKEANRWPGSEWIKNHPALLERVYDWTKLAAQTIYPWMKRISPAHTKRIMIWTEEVTKGYLFNCQMCGQCILHSTGMTCSMNCPKNLRNGPCGGVRANGHCEVIPDRMCVWVQAYERSQQMPLYGHEMNGLQPPINRALHNSSAWINMFEGIDTKVPVGWVPLSELENTTR